MNRRTLLNLGLLALLALLVLVAVYEPGKAPPPAAPTLTPLAPERIERLRIERRDASTVVLERGGPAGWRLLEPVAVPANASRVERVVDVVKAKTFARFTATDADLARYGLDTPAARLTLDGATTIAFGSATPLDQRRYVQIGEEIAVVNDAYFYHVIGNAGGYASQRLLPIDARIEALELPKLRVQRDEQGHWQVEPAPEKLSADAVATLMTQWEMAQAYEVRLAPEKADGESISVRLAGRETPFRFLLSKADGDVLLTRPEVGLTYRLTEYTADALLQLPTPPVEAASPSPDP